MRKAVRIAIGAIAALTAAAGVAVLWLSGSLPQTEGRLRVAGLKATASIARDDDGVPHIFAKTEDDAYFALGFAHAQDRLWQMEMHRRVGAGRLAELFGPKAVPSDRFMRTLGLYRLAEQSLAQLAPEVGRALEAYAAGVNAFLAARQGPLPPEFVVLGIAPENWRPADSLVWARLMAMQLAGNWRDELLRVRLAKTLPGDQLADLWPGYPAGQPITVGLDDGLVRHLLAAIPPVLEPHLASNAWVVSGQRSETGKPLLANDPHLGFQAPILWYLARLSAPGLEVAGGTVPGTPFHLLGHNRHIAWGMTTTQSDTMDLFIEKPEGDGYLTPDGPAPFVTRSEVIAVKGEAPVTLTVRETRHGPVISDVIGDRANGQILALSAVALRPDDLTAQAVYRIAHAHDRASFVEALKDFHAPQQNVFYADTDGHIGMVSPGRVPIRASGDGTLPRPGWTGEFDWTGWVPFDALPSLFDPPSGIIVNANNKVVADDYPYLLTATWPDGYRARRIIDRLESKRFHAAADMAGLQMDEHSLMAEELTPLLLAGKPANPRAEAVFARLRAWDGTATGERPEPLIVEGWLSRLQANILGTWLGPEADSFPALHPLFLKAVLTGRTVWCGPKKGPIPADCTAAVALALEQTLDELERHHGKDIAGWRWDSAHIATFDALFFRYVPGLSQLTRLAIGTGGDDVTVQRGAFTQGPDGTFRHGHGAGLRAVYDLGDLDASRFIIATGQSGNPLSSHWGDLLKRWRDGEMITLSGRPQTALVLMLEPG